MNILFQLLNSDSPPPGVDIPSLRLQIISQLKDILAVVPRTNFYSERMAWEVNPYIYLFGLVHFLISFLVSYYSYSSIQFAAAVQTKDQVNEQSKNQTYDATSYLIDTLAQDQPISTVNSLVRQIDIHLYRIKLVSSFIHSFLPSFIFFPSFYLFSSSSVWWETSINWKKQTLLLPNTID